MYKAPIEEIAFALKKVAGLEPAMEKGLLGELTPDLLDAVLEEAGRFASEKVAPLAEVGDREGTSVTDGVVTTPTGWKELYADWIAGGWNALTGPEEYGGQALPTSLSAAVFEMWNSASMGFALGPTLTVGAVEALETHGSDELKAAYLAKLVSGEWNGTMNLTEPQAGSDLSALKTKAERAGDGSYRIFGQKIYITYGEHDFTDNIVHLVLARLPDAPAGVKGISLFLVPKFLVEADGSLGRRNDVFCHSVEHKLGIHGSPTCTMIYGDGSVDGEEAGAVGYLIGEENRGLACMFTMMNNARLLVGVQGVGVAEAAFQMALDYARERRQGRSTRLAKDAEPSGQMSPIVEHPDVARSLLTMKALTGSARAIAYACGHASDMARATRDDATEAKAWKERANLLTPIAKAFATDIGVEVASLGIQVHGGMGFIEETGAARLLRDARIAPIYEGTNGIQAIDLVTRKIGQSDGAAVSAYLAELAETVDAVRGRNAADFGVTGEALAAALDDLKETTAFLAKALAAKDMDTALAGATSYLRLFGLTAGAVYLAKGALADTSRTERTHLARFMAENLLTETSALKRQVVAGAASLAAAHAILQ
ncbi:acyl-CoA dehydrogenase [Aurantimonas sp. C2-6-R+9]|uniref:acyl-CoA dehydrogenase n=1 Tax=unclassified Aurantimonas TaxID=2638230 RepID=UPI002E1757D5|nr:MULTISPECIES: acyl-CoA dehydrogenase [unclassified Aurantimonas]MEC5289089.1 acyl-CoA dehydrogenase [Aurantimonas sp. C2-3-R2]MEC5379336.1 acyl-CoA dehydrogenase [Aurantimonas sp. C2-6-R+9]MEC5410089.1 acyl-CoA dehydrogenase [Aurantimonas sp. C2-4-R8]